MVNLKSLFYGNVKSFTTLELKYEYVDLGLSVKWATCNVGATSPTDYGDYFAWGETEPYYQPGYAQSESPLWKSGKSAGYAWSTYKYCNGSYRSMTKYCNSSSYGTVDNKTVLDLTDDAARANWGGSWRMPTKAEFDELSSSSNCTWTWYASGNSEFNGVAGYKVISKKSGYAGNYVFLPAAGYRYDTSLGYAGSYGNYWSSSLLTDYPDNAWGLSFYSDYLGTGSGNRDCGRSVRPVCPVAVTGITISSQSLEMFETMTTSLTAMLSPSESSNYTVYWSSSNPGVATVSSTGMVTAIKSGTCTITATCEDLSATCSVTVKPWEPEYVDLGLSVKWATCNVGAFSPEGYGDYFAWGETEPHYQPGYAQSGSPLWKSAGYDWRTYKYCNGSYETLTKYCTSSSYGTVDYKAMLDLTDDAACANWGGSWRMPTQTEFEELLSTDNCTWTWYESGNSEFNGVAGYKVTSRKSGYVGNYIFLPAAGCRYDTSLGYAGSSGYYWSSPLDTDYPYFARILYFDSDYLGTGSGNRDCGRSVRPVCPVAVTGITISSQSLEMYETTTATLSATLSPPRASGYTVTWSSSNPGVATVSSTGMVTAIKSGTCTITATYEDLSATCSVTVKPWEPEYVDLGLSVKWATCNVGAFSPEGYGDYFAWGETEPHYQPGYAQSESPLWKSGKSAGYDWSTYKYCNGSSSTMTKYCTKSSYGTVDYEAMLDLTDDAARANWGGSWCMPTPTEFEELLNRDNCAWIWYASGNSEFNGVAGYKVTSRKSGYKGNYIFLPAAGYRVGTSLDNAGSSGGYWSSFLDTGGSSVARGLYFSSVYRGTSGSRNFRYYGRSVRPVCP